MTSKVSFTDVVKTNLARNEPTTSRVYFSNVVKQKASLLSPQLLYKRYDYPLIRKKNPSLSSPYGNEPVHHQYIQLTCPIYLPQGWLYI